MNHYKSEHQICKEFCVTLVVSEAHVREYRAIANEALDYLLLLLYDQHAGRLVVVDEQRVVVLLDRLISAQGSEK